MDRAWSTLRRDVRYHRRRSAHPRRPHTATLLLCAAILCAAIVCVLW